MAALRACERASRLAKYKIPEFPFWRQSGTSISDMLVNIQEYKNRYTKCLSGKSSSSISECGSMALGEYLFQVNKIEKEGFQTYEETQEAISRGALQLEEIQSDQRLEALRCLHKAFRLMYPAGNNGISSTQPVQLSLPKILQVHGELLKSTKPDIAGRVRREPHETVFTRTAKGGYHVFMLPLQVEGALEELIRSANSELETGFGEDSVERTGDLLKFAARFFFEFEYIHPFLDGNGRVGRIILAALLRSVMPFPNVLFVESSMGEPPFVDKLDYYQCFEKAQDEQSVEIVSTAGLGPPSLRVWQDDLAEHLRYPPVDLAALVIEGAYVGWKRFCDRLETQLFTHHHHIDQKLSRLSFPVARNLVDSSRLSFPEFISSLVSAMLTVGAFSEKIAEIRSLLDFLDGAECAGQTKSCISPGPDSTT